VGYLSVSLHRAVLVHVAVQVIASLNGDAPTVTVVGQILAVVVATTQRAAQAGADAVQVSQRNRVYSPSRRLWATEVCWSGLSRNPRWITG
jgi:hypothetical protein